MPRMRDGRITKCQTPGVRSCLCRKIDLRFFQYSCGVFDVFAATGRSNMALCRKVQLPQVLGKLKSRHCIDAKIHRLDSGQGAFGDVFTTEDSFPGDVKSLQLS